MKDTIDSLKSQAENRNQTRSLVQGSYLKTGYKIYAYENSLYFKDDINKQHRERPYMSRRGDVRQFSESSRKRLLRIFSRIQISNYKAMHFVTLTYHEAWREADHNPQKDLNSFLQSLRDKYESIDYIWRLEFQKRGAPHYHLIIMFPNGTKAPKYSEFLKYCVSSWHRIADPESDDHAAFGVQGAQLNDYRMAFAYCSKYSAKEESSNEFEYKGRRWGTSTTLALKPVLALELPYAQYMMIRQLVRSQIMAKGNIHWKFANYLNESWTCHTYIDINNFLKAYNQVFQFTSRKGWKNILECIWLQSHWEPADLLRLKVRFT